MECGQYEATTNPSEPTKVETPRQNDESQVDPGAAAKRPDSFQESIMPELVKTTLRLTDDLLRVVKIIAIKKNTTFQDLVIEALNQYVAEYKKGGRK